MGPLFLLSTTFFTAVWAIVTTVICFIAIIKDLSFVNECRKFERYESDNWGPYVLYQCDDVNKLDNAIIQGSIKDDFQFILIIWLLLELILGVCGVLIIVAGLLNLKLVLVFSQIGLLVVCLVLILVDFVFLLEIIGGYKGRSNFPTYLGQMVGQTDEETGKAVAKKHKISCLTNFTSRKLQHLFYRCLSHIFTLIFAGLTLWNVVFKIFKCC